MRVPDVYAIDNGSKKPFPPPHTRYEAPCLYMEFLEGMTATDRIALEEPAPEIINSLHKQLANITAKMMSSTCPAAGVIGVDSSTGNLRVHPGKKYTHRHYETPAAFYKTIGREFFGDHLASQAIDCEESFKLLRKFHSLYATMDPSDSFCLINDDLGFHNVLTNEKWEITAIIDIDCVYAGPWTWALKPLSHSMMNVRPDSLIDMLTTQLIRDQQIKSKQAFEYFIREIGSALWEQSNEDLAQECENFIKAGGIKLMLGLEAYQWADHDLHMAWLTEYAKLPISLEDETNPTDNI